MHTLLFWVAVITIKAVDEETGDRNSTQKQKRNRKEKINQIKRIVVSG